MSVHDEPNSSKHICHTISVYPTNSSKQTSTAEHSNNEFSLRQKEPEDFTAVILFFSSPPFFSLPPLFCLF